MEAPRQHRAAIYLRVSLDATGQQLAVSRQREDCLKIVRDRGWAVSQEYVDNSISASDRRRKRPAYDRMSSDFAAGHFDALVCWDLDRLTRQPRQLEDWIDAATDRGLRLVTANGEADLTTDAGRLFARIKASVARSEVERKAARQTRANRQRAEQGMPPSGVRLTGYTTRGDLEPDEAKIIRRVFAEFVDGRALRAICDGLEQECVKARHGSAWNPSTIRTILTNPRYSGQAIYQGQPIEAPATWPTIVDPDTFALAQAMLKDPRRRTQRSTERRHIGSGLYRCGHCGRAVRSWSGRRYRCPDGCVTRSGIAVDELVEALVRERLSQPDLYELLADPATSTEAVDLMAESRRLQNRLRTIGEDYDSGMIDGLRYREAREKVIARLREIEQRQATLVGASGPARVLRAASPANAFDSASLTTRQSVIGLLMNVRLQSAPRGSRTFEPSSVVIEWRSS